MVSLSKAFGRCLLPAAICGLAVLASAAERSASYLAAMNSITTEELAGHVGYLADDALQGRQPGTPGGLAAAQYLEQAFRDMGLQPAGTDGGFFQPFPPNYRNVLGWVPGSDLQLAGEYVLVGGHFDHVGYGNRRNSRGGIGQIHNGADDNASGTAAVIEVAEAVTLLPRAPRRSILFALWDAEEMGLLGSKHWSRQPTVPLDRVVAAVHMDMVGRLRDDHVEIFGTRTGYGLRKLISLQNDEPAFQIDFGWGIPANSDHYILFERHVPSILLHTGLHDDYHTPRDDAQLINSDGIRRVGQWAFRLVTELADRDAPPPFRAQAASEPKPADEADAPSVRPGVRLGVHWPAEEENDTEPGVVVSAVVPDSPANRADLQPGDRIVEFDQRPLFSGREFRRLVQRAESPVDALVERAGQPEPQRVSIPLDGAPIRVGITWRTDEAEPATVVLSYVVPASPADDAGLRPGDRIYRIDGHDFAGEEAFAERVRSSPGPLEFLVERDGRVWTVRLYLTPEQAEEELRKKSA